MPNPETDYLFDEPATMSLDCENPDHHLGELGCVSTEQASYFLYEKHSHDGFQRVFAICQGHTIWRRSRQNDTTRCGECYLTGSLADMTILIKAIPNRKQKS